MGVQRWEKKLYRTQHSRDPVAQFLSVLVPLAHEDADVLDLGAGAGKNRYALKGRVRHVVGADLDSRVAANPMLDSAVIIGNGPLPFADESFDIVFCIYVLEHVAEPRELVREVHRVLRPRGFFLALTPNRYHYVSLVSRLTPTRFHKWLNARRGREAGDTFQVFYRMNSRRSLLEYFAQGFRCVRLSMIEVEPHYLKFSTPAFLLGAMYERLVNSVDWLAEFRVNIVCAFQKKD